MFCCNRVVMMYGGNSQNLFTIQGEEPSCINVTAHKVSEFLIFETS